MFWPSSNSTSNDIHVELPEGRPRVRNNSCLRLSFEQIWERPPTRRAAERGVIFSVRELDSIYRLARTEVGLIPRA